MKPCHGNNDASIYVGRAATVHNRFLKFTLQLNILTGTFLLVSCSNSFQSIVVCVRSRPKILPKT